MLENDWDGRVANIQSQLRREQEPPPCTTGVADVRALGAIGVLELEQPCDVAATQKLLVEQGVWIRPFGKLVYIMPPFIIEPDQLTALTSAMAAVTD
ncbi:MAG: aminotransferase class III-fold pyridoxal phosphate-dependent enzyme [Alcanivorax sp.]